MPKPKLYDNARLIRLSTLMLDRIKATSEADETFGAFIRAAVDRELARRERNLRKGSASGESHVHDKDDGRGET